MTRGRDTSQDKAGGRYLTLRELSARYGSDQGEGIPHDRPGVREELPWDPTRYISCDDGPAAYASPAPSPSFAARPRSGFMTEADMAAVCEDKPLKDKPLPDDPPWDPDKWRSCLETATSYQRDDGGPSAPSDKEQR
ncbi:MAG: hypothetical protein PHT12_05380 [Patescibacteria group bacterium]|nr:hypothetical protein [Patescibacteria group bacterium]